MDWFIKLAWSGGPAVVALALLYLLIRKDVKQIQQDVGEIKTTHVHCSAHQGQANAELHGRVTQIQDRVSRVEGRLNGHGGAA